VRRYITVRCTAYPAEKTLVWVGTFTFYLRLCKTLFPNFCTQGGIAYRFVPPWAGPEDKPHPVGITALLCGPHQKLNVPEEAITTTDNPTPTFQSRQRDE